MTLRPPWDVDTLPDGRTRFRRRFGRPRTLDTHETVWLVGETPGGTEVRLNGEPLGVSDGRFAFDVTRLLAVRNEVHITATGQLGPVAIEVRTTGTTVG